MVSESFCAITRAAISVAPPAVKPTTRRTGRAGYGCAVAGIDAAIPAVRTPPISNRVTRLLFMNAPPYESAYSKLICRHCDVAHTIAASNGRTGYVQSCRQSGGGDGIDTRYRQSNHRADGERRGESRRLQPQGDACEAVRAEFAARGQEAIAV